MSKTRTVYVCTNCGYESVKWLGKCPSCDSWNTFSEEIRETKKSAKKKPEIKSEVFSLNDLTIEKEIRIKTGIGEFDRVLGGGLIYGSAILIAGDPGIGKSTLVMQAAANIKGKTLYVTGEESTKQIKVRAERLKVNNDSLLILAETNLEGIKNAIENTAPDVVIIDSIQTIFNPEFDNGPGTVTQIRECTLSLMNLAKEKNFAIVLVGHVTKEGFIAGPKVLEHIVDAVIQFEGDKNNTYRILRALKNRYGNTNEIGIFEMHDDGLSEVNNPSELFLSERHVKTTGSIVTSSMEGTRPVLFEVQALVTPSNFGNPQRVATGFDYRRLSILLAVLEKRAGFRLSSHNVFLNMAGGIRIFEPAVDLAVCAAITSSISNTPARESLVVIGEVGLGGEIRSVSNVEKRIQEAEKLGFKNIVLPKSNLNLTNGKFSINLIPVENISSAIEKIFEIQSS